MAYTPNAIPEDTPPALKAWLANELYRIGLELRRLEERIAELEAGEEE